MSARGSREREFEVKATDPRVTRARALALRARARVEGIPFVGRVVEEWRRVEVVDRAMVTAAQALLALVPLVVVLVTFLPADLTRAGLERLADITGLADASVDRAVRPVRSSTTAEDVRAQVGVVGAVVTVLSASSFARAVMRAYERVWDLPSLTGFRGRRRALGWLLVWLCGLEVLGLTSRALGRWGAPTPLALATQAILASLLWWWTLRVLLAGRRTWTDLAVPAALSGIALTAFTNSSSAVMPTYSLESVRQFGGFGLVLALATWLVALSAVLVVSAILGRAADDQRAVLVRRRADRPSTTPGRRLTPSG